MVKRWGVLGGTFDPVHYGHLAIAQTACSQVPLDGVFWVVTRHPPHKAQKPPTAAVHRCKMVDLAIAPYPQFQQPQLPLVNEKPDYAIATKLALQQLDPDAQWYWILGSDAFAKLPQWYRASELIAACEWLVAPRDSQSLLQGFSDPIRWQLLEMTPLAISSSQIRQAAQKRHALSSFVPKPVEHYVSKHQLYLDPNP